MADLFEKLDWSEVQARLVGRARKVFSEEGLSPDAALAGFGHGPEDLVMEAIMRLLDPDDTTVVWKSPEPPTEDAVVGFLSKVIQNDFLDCVRSPRSRVEPLAETATAEDGEEPEDPPAELPCPNAADEDDLLAGVGREGVTEQLLAMIDEDDELLRRYVELQLGDGDYADYRPRMAAAKLGVEVSEVNNAKKRLKRHLLAMIDQPGFEGSLGLVD